MGIIKISDIKDQIEALVTRVQAGETILIERDGKMVARIVPSTERDRFDFDALKKFTDSQPMQTESAGDFVRRMRDEARY